MTARVFLAWIPILLSLLAHHPARGQDRFLPSLDPGKAIHQYVHEVWQADDGLPNYAINSIVQTRTGFLWLATHGGIVRFDGVEFEVFNRENTPELVNSYVSSLLETADGSLWMGSRGSGLLRWENGRFQRWTRQEGLPDDSVTALEADPLAGFWIATLDGVAHYDEGSFTAYTTENGLPHNSATCLEASQDGDLWVGTYGGLARFEDDAWVRLEVPGLGDRAVQSILQDRAGHLWLAAADAPLRRLAGDRWIEYPDIQNSRTIFEDRAGTIWTDSERGLVRIDGDTPTRFTPADGLTDARIYSLFEDREANLWIGTYGGGLNRLKNGSLTTFTDKDGLIDNIVQSTYEDASGILWIGTQQGLVRMEDGQTTNYGTAEGLRDDDVLAIIADRAGVLWVGTMEGGLHRFDGQAFTAVEGIDGRRIANLFEDRSGALWIGSEPGLYRLVDGAVALFEPTGPAPRGRVVVVHEDRDGVLWVGTQGGLARFEAGKFVAVAGFEGVWIRALHEDADGTLWIGTVGEGLYRLRAGSLTQYTTADGMPDDFVWDILEDDQARLWMSSDQGIFWVGKADLEDYALGTIDRLCSRRLDTADGMKTIEGVGFVHPGAFATRSGHFWFPTMQGAVRLKPDQLLRNSLPPSVAIKSVVVGDRRMVPSSGSRLKLTPHQRDLEIHYAGLSFRVPEKVRFRYRLEGYDEGWTEAGSRRVAFYTNLPAGSFVFRVTAANEDGVWSESGAAFEFSRQPALTETLWFHGMLVVLAVGLGAGLFTLGMRNIRARNLRLNRLNLALNEEVVERRRIEAELAARNRELELNNQELEKKNAEMERFSYTVSHDLKTPLVSIEGFLGLLEQDVRKADGQAVEHDLGVIRSAVQKMGRLLHDLLEYSRCGRFVQPPEAVSLNVLVDEVLEPLTTKLAERGVTVVVQPDLPTVWGDAMRLREVFQNLLENSAKFFADQTRPCLEVGAGEVDHGFVTCFVRDNGIGVEPQYQEQIFRLFERLNPSIEGTGVGLALVKRIVEFHGGQIWVESEGTGKGTTVLFTLPVAPDATVVADHHAPDLRQTESPPSAAAR